MPRLEITDTVYRNQKVFGQGSRKWIMHQARINTMKDFKLWRKSGEIGRLLYLIQEREDVFDGYMMGTFTVKPSDRVSVCEADFLRQYHVDQMSSLDAHVAYAESRVSLKKYDGSYALPEFIVCNPIRMDRIKWTALPKGTRPIKYDKRGKKPEMNMDISY